jgi:hypothetical protein
MPFALLRVISSPQVGRDCPELGCATVTAARAVRGGYNCSARSDRTDEFTQYGITQRGIVAMRIANAAAVGLSLMLAGPAFAENQKVAIDVSIGGEPAGTITFELFSDVVPKTDG